MGHVTRPSSPLNVTVAASPPAASQSVKKQRINCVYSVRSVYFSFLVEAFQFSSRFPSYQCNMSQMCLGKLVCVMEAMQREEQMG